MHKRLLIVFILGFSSGLPLALVSSTLQAWFAEAGMSTFATSSLSLLGFPYVYRMLWAPLMDRYALFSLGKRRSWILSMQLLLLTGFNVIAWFSPTSSPLIMAGIGFLLASFSATQDIAVDAHRTEYLLEKEHAIGASLAVFGYRFALLISGGLALLIASTLGFAMAYRIMGFLMLFGMIATLWSPEPSLPWDKSMTVSESFVAPVKELLARKGLAGLLFFIFFYKLGEAFTTITSGIVMPFLIQGLGFSLDTIAYVYKIMGVCSVLIGGLFAGLLMMRWSLFKSLMAFGVFQALSNILFVVLSVSGTSLPMLVCAVFFDNLATGMGTTALVAFFMRLVDKQFTATQFSLFVALSTIPRILSGPIAATLQSWVGWTGLYQLSVILALLFIPFLIFIREQTVGLLMVNDIQPAVLNH